MIYFRSNIGRLGNQLFIFAYALYLKKEYGSNYILSDPQFLKYFKDPFYLFINWVKSQFFFRILIKLKGYRKVNITNKVGYISNIDDTFIQSNIKCIGYFQSPLFFDRQAIYIKKRLRISKPYQKKFAQKYGTIFNNHHVTTIHIRRTDYTNHKIKELKDTPVILPFEYYKKAIDQLRYANTQFVLIGDDISFLKTEFRFLDNSIIIHDDEIIDFQVLMQANACIISNSTFAWWGAYLNTKQNCQIIAPKYFLGYNAKREFPNDIYPRGWQLID